MNRFESKVPELDETSDSHETLSETGNGTSTGSGVSALFGVLSSLFARKNTQADDIELLITKEKKKPVAENQKSRPKKSAVKYIIKRFIPKMPKNSVKTRKNDQKKRVVPRRKGSTSNHSSKSFQLLTENSGNSVLRPRIPEVLKTFKNEEKRPPKSEEKSPARFASLDSHEIYSKDRIMHMMNFPPNTFRNEQKRIHRPLIASMKVSVPLHLTSRNTQRSPSEDNTIMHLMNFQKKPILKENEQNKCVKPSEKSVNVADLRHLSSCSSNKLPSEENRKHVMYFPSIPKPHKNDKNKCAETITNDVKAAAPKHISKGNSHDMSNKDSNLPSMYPSNQSTAAKIDEDVTRRMSISNKLPDLNLMNSEGIKPDQVKLMFRNHFVEDFKTPDSLLITNGDCIKVFF